MAKTQVELEAQLKRLQAELERKRLEEQIRALESQLQTTRVAAAPPHEGTESEYIEEVIEETEGYIEEELIEEDPAPAPAAPPAAKTGKLSPAKIAAVAPPAAQQSAKVELPPLPPFTPRVVPKTPNASPPGSETPMEVWLGPKLYKNGKMVSCPTKAGVDGMDLVLLYIGASYHRECKDFLPLLQDFYKIGSQGPEALFEVVYISRDRNMVMFKEAFAKMPWLSMPPGTSQLKNKLAQDLKLLDQPCLVVMDMETGLVISTNGVEQIMGLERRNVPMSQGLVQFWRNSEGVAPEQIAFDTRLKNGTMQRGTLYWQE